MPNAQTFRTHCACARIEHEADGAPIVALACYCDDCQAAGRYVDSMLAGRSGLCADGGTVSIPFRKDRVRCVRGEELLIAHKLRPNSPTTRVIAGCCNSNLLTRYDNWLPFVALRTFSANGAEIVPQMSLYTRFAPDVNNIAHPAPRHPTMPPSLGLKVMGNAVQLWFRRIWE